MAQAHLAMMSLNAASSGLYGQRWLLVTGDGTGRPVRGSVRLRTTVS
jgi:hypothetical protein